MSATPGLCLEYLPLPGGGARLVRLYGETPCPVLPDAVDGLPLTELGPYCFAPRQRERLLPPESTLRRYTVPAPAADGPRAARGRRYDFADEPTAPESLGADAPALPPRIAGKFLEEITLPDGLRVIGEAAFYDCRALRRVSLGGGVTAVGSDALTNTMALTRLTVRTAPEAPGGTLRLLAPLRGEVAVEFCPAGGAPAAVLWFPEYWEDVAETPAHILIPSFSGRGYHYRQCFTAAGAVDFKEYDAILAMTGEGDEPATLAAMAFDRLRYPAGLTADAAARYRAWLAAEGHGLLCVQRLLRAQDTDALHSLLALELLDPDALRAAAELARAADNAEATALLTGALQGKGRRRVYAFD